MILVMQFLSMFLSRNRTQASALQEAEREPDGGQSPSMYGAPENDEEHGEELNMKKRMKMRMKVATRRKYQRKKRHSSSSRRNCPGGAVTTLSSTMDPEPGPST